MHQNHFQLVLRDIPIFQWVFGILFAGVGALIIHQGGGRSAGFWVHLCGCWCGFPAFRQRPDHHREPDDTYVET